ncbi:MAG: O-antigen ligase family protein [Ruminococcus sp.]|nr:O-antigen ligase family protein [Ruminococcus sp.]
MDKEKNNKKPKKDDKPNKGHKHLFGTSEKSDFILNMDSAGAQKMCAGFIAIAVAVITVMAVPAYFTQRVGEYQVGDVSHYLSENFIFYSAAMLMLAGGVGYLVFYISAQKGNVSLRSNKLLAVPVLMLIAGLVSCFTAKSLHDSMLGYVGWHDGLLTLAGCVGLFAVACAVSDTKRRSFIADVLVIAGVFNAVTGILQVIPATSKLMHNYFEYLYVRPGTSAGSGEVYLADDGPILSGIYTKSDAASGFLTSPHALAALLSVTFAAALAGAAFCESKKRRLLYAVSAPVMAAAACLTQVRSAVWGLAAGAAVILVMIVLKLIKKDKGALVGLAALAASAVAAVVLFTAAGAQFNDEKVIFTNGYIVRGVGYPGRYEYATFSADYGSDKTDIYKYLSKDGEYIITRKPVMGVGFDNLDYHYSDYSLSTDRIYNEYLDIGASRGIVGLALYGIFMVITLIKAIKAAIRALGGEADWLAPMALAAVAAYMVQGIFNTTWAFSTYFVFIAAGLAWSYEILGKKQKS